MIFTNFIQTKKGLSRKQKLSMLTKNVKQLLNVFSGKVSRRVVYFTYFFSAALILNFKLSYMKVLQLCFFTNLIPVNHTVLSYDLKTGQNILDTPDYFGKLFDLIIAAPPCDQFTKANSSRWLDLPLNFILIAEKCLEICINSGKPWILENPPGRIEKFIPALTKFRITTWTGYSSNKEYVVYSNHLLPRYVAPRYGKPSSNANMTKRQREAWTPEFYNYVIQNFNL